MQIRELSSSECEEGFVLLSHLHPDLTSERFDTFIASQFPRDYRPIGAYEKGELCIYAGVSIRENLELGQYLIIDDFVTCEGYEHLSHDMIDYLADYAKMHRCENIFLWGKQRGLKIEDLKGFRPKRDGFIKTL